MIKKLLFLAIVTIMVTHTHTAYAYTANITPNPVEDDTTDVILHVTGGAVAEHGVLFASNGRVLTGFGFGDGDVSMGSISGMVSGGWWVDTVPFGTLSFLDIPQADVEDCIANYDSASFEYELGSSPTENILQICEGMFNTIATTYYGVNNNQTWGSPNGFWGDTTPTQIIGDMEASVQATGVNIWPLMTFVGIPIAFLIALYLIWLINKTLTPPKKSDENVINPQGENFIYHNAEDLEFKRNYGQPKRGRGRPRKYPL